jgi:transcriptional regulator with XRE-family HTH domain
MDKAEGLLGLRSIRKQKHWNQLKVAMDLNISREALSHYENGIRECSLDFVVTLAKFYGVSCDYLLGATQDKSTTSKLHTEALALDAVLTAADKMQDKASGEAVTKAADCCVFALADAVLGEHSEYNKRAAHCSLGAAEVFMASVNEETEISDQNLAKTAKVAENTIKTIGK